jgi:hypothetical protein
MTLEARVLLLSALLTTACAREGAEEVHAAESEVPVVVRAAGERIATQLGGTLGEWAWDRESLDWEVAVLGLTRQAELDILPDGRFSELELVHSLDEVQAALPRVFQQIQAHCHDDRRAFVELSLRREEYLVALPTLAEAWERDGVVLEFQCSNGNDYELDARELLLEHRLDDTESAR